MNTTEDLRTALRHKADTAPPFDADALLRAVHAERSHARRPGNRLAPVTVAAAVVAVAATSAVLAHHNGSAGPTALGGASSQTVPSGVATPAAPFHNSTSTSDAPPSSSPTTPDHDYGTTSSPPAPTFVHVSSTDKISSTDLRPKVQFVTTQVGVRHTAIAVYATGVFSASRVTGAVPVTVDGTPGLFGEVSVWPVNGRPDPVSGKQDAPQSSLAWQVGRHWVVLQIDHPDHPGVAQLQEAAERLTISAAD